MADESVGKILLDLELNTQNLKKELNNLTTKTQNAFSGIKSTVDSAGKSIQSVMQSAFDKVKTAAKVAAAGITAAIGTTLTKGFLRLKTIDEAKAKLEGLGNTAEDIADIMESANAAVKGTSYGLDEAATTAASAVAAGIKPGEELTKYLSLTASAAAVAGRSMSDMGAIFNKVQTSQAAYTEELNQLADAGIPIYQWLGEEAGLTAAEIKEMASEGKISSGIFLEAVEKNIGGAAAVVGDKSFTGALSNIWAAVGRIGANFLDATGDGVGFFSQIKPLMVDFKDYLGEIEEKAKSWGQTFGEVFKGVVGYIRDGEFNTNGMSEQAQGALNNFIFPVIDGIKGIKEGLQKAFDGIDLSFFKNLGFGKNIAQSFSKIGKLKIWDELNEIFSSLSEIIKDGFTEFQNFVKNTSFKPLEKAVGGLWEAFKNLSGTLLSSVKKAYNSVLKPLAKWTIEKALPKIVDTLAKAFKKLGDILDGIDADAWQGIASALVGIGTAVATIKIGSSVISGLSNIKTVIGSMATSFSSLGVVGIIGGVAAAITGLITGLRTYQEIKFQNSDIGQFCSEMHTLSEDLYGIAEEINDFREGQLEQVTDLSTDMGVIDDYQTRLNELLTDADLSESEQAELTTIADYFCDTVPDFDEAWQEIATYDEDGHLKLQGNIDNTKEKLNELIDTYQLLAAKEALTDLNVENSKEMLAQNKEVGIKKEELNTAREELINFISGYGYTLEEFEKDLTKWRNGEKTERMYDGYLQGIDQIGNGVLVSNGGKLFDAFAEARDGYNAAAEELNNLYLTSQDYSGMLNVLNGDYSNAANVMLAYQSGLITEQQVVDNTKKSIEELSKEAKASGENLTLGLHEGTQEYKDLMKKDGEGCIKTFVDAAKTEAEIHSPSRKTARLGGYLIQGFGEGIKSNLAPVKAQMTAAVNALINPFEAIKSRFSGIFSGAWGAVKTGANNIIGGIENMVNGFIRGINTMIGGVDTVVSAAGSLFGQEWNVPQIPELSLPRLAKGGLVTAPTLALVGDNKGAGAGNPEVVAPLNKLQSMIGSGDGEYSPQMIAYLAKIYELLVVLVENGGSTYEFVANLDGDPIFREMVRRNDIYKKRHNGAGAF